MTTETKSKVRKQLNESEKKSSDFVRKGESSRVSFEELRFDNSASMESSRREKYQCYRRNCQKRESKGER